MGDRLPPAGHGPLRWLAPMLPATVTFAIVIWGITGPSLWRDEAATLSAAERSFPSLLTMLGHVDAVHGAYYLLMWALVRLLGAGELAVRLPSALAMAAASGLVTVLGRRLVCLRAGLASGLVFAALPAVSWFGQDARPFALETALACGASWLLLQALAASSRRSRRRALAWYWLALTALGLVSLFGLLLVPAHAVTIAIRRDEAGRRVRAGWLTAAAGAALALTPLGLLAWRQRDQIAWLSAPGLAQLSSLTRLTGGTRLAAAVLAVLAAGLALSALKGRARLGRDLPAPLLGLSLPWLLLPPAVLFAVSVLEPVYLFRYIVFCIPAAALLTGAALAALGRAAASAGLILVLVLGLPAQVGERGPAGHGDGIRWADRVLAGQELPGDGVLYLGGPGMRTFALAYPYGLARLRDIALGQTAAASGTISGTDAALTTVRKRLAHVSRVWVAQAGADPPSFDVAALRGLPFRIAGTWRVTDIWLTLYAREGGVAVAGEARVPLPGYPDVPLPRH